ncbi:hypothetical protein M426DRAFT_318258 [Hypoxylon sp. CI-4A]|nr:hypothetical protein M426DRAFT_318258 [Hypoxylon sp. CI-4A]
MPPLIPIRCTSAYSSSHAAKAFVRLLCASSPPICSNNSILDVLLPPRARAFHLAAAATTTTTNTGDLRQPITLRSRNRNIQLRSHGGRATTAAINPEPRRSFSATTHWRKTQAVYNPQKDEEGNDMVLEITPRAANKLSQIMTKDKNPNLALRISVESGGCHGFQYLMSLTTLPPTLSATAAAAHSPPIPPETSADAKTAAAEVVPSTTTSASTTATPSIGEDDTIFEFVKEEAEPEATTQQQQQKDQPSAKIILDGPSLDLLKGSKVDFTMELIGSQFKIVDNPAATSSCGCGTSFDIKI